MDDPDSCWEEYTRLQEKLDRRRAADSISWGLEGSMNRLLDRLPAVPVRKLVASETRKQRYRARLQGLAAANQRQAHVDSPLAADSKDALEAVRLNCAPNDWRILRAVGEGFTYREISVFSSVGESALRVRVLRLRKKLRPVVAEVLLEIAS